MSAHPRTGALPTCADDCIDHLRMTVAERNLAVVKINALVTAASNDAAIAAIEETHQRITAIINAPLAPPVELGA